MGFVGLDAAGAKYTGEPRVTAVRQGEALSNQPVSFSPCLTTSSDNDDLRGEAACGLHANALMRRQQRVMARVLRDRQQDIGDGDKEMRRFASKLVVLLPPSRGKRRPAGVRLLRAFICRRAGLPIRRGRR